MLTLLSIVALPIAWDLALFAFVLSVDFVVLAPVMLFAGIGGTITGLVILYRS